MKRRPAITACAASAALLHVAGCNSISSFSHPVPTSQAQYRAYGDSITRGAGLSDPATEVYPVLVAAREQVTFANNSFDGDGSCDVSPNQIFLNQDSPTLASHPTYTVLIGANDVGQRVGVPPVFIQCHQAVLSWLGVPLEYKVLANGSGVKTSGPGALDKTNNWNSWTTGGKGATVSFTITTTHDGPIYAWSRIDDNSPGTYTYSLDEVELRSGSVQTNPKILTKNGRTASMTLTRIPSVPAGKHVVTFTQTNVGSEGVSVVGIGTPEGAAGDKLPIVFSGTMTFFENNGSGGRCTVDDALCNAYLQDEQNDVTLLAADGLDIRIFDTRKYMLGTPAEMNDASHPNVRGHEELSKSVEAAWQ